MVIDLDKSFCVCVCVCVCVCNKRDHARCLRVNVKLPLRTS